MKTNKLQNIEFDVTWLDDIAPFSYKLVILKYELACVRCKKLNDGRVNITLSGSKANAKAFMEDYEDDAFEMLDTISIACKSDEDYIEAIKKQIDKLS